MLVNDKEFLSAIASGATSKDEVVEYLLENFSVKALANDVAERVIAEAMAPEPVSVSYEQINSLMNQFSGMFKVRGIRADGSAETRGRKKKED